MSYAIAEPAAEPADACERGTAEADLALAIALHRHLAEVQALEDQIIDADGAVRCLECGEPIDAARLAALAPLAADGVSRDLFRSTATRHVECQADHEQRQRRRGHV